jgi:hypothetical protein
MTKRDDRDEQMIRIAQEFRPGPDQEVPDAFLDYLAKFPTLIGSSTVDTLTKSHPYIPRVLGAVLVQSPICTVPDVCDIIADSLLAFMCPTGPDTGEQAQSWAADRLSRKTKQSTSEDIEVMKCSKASCFDAVLDFPSEFVAQLPNETLLSLASVTPDGLMNAIVEELLRRSLAFDPHFLEAVNLRTAASRLLFEAFARFIEVPSLDAAFEFWRVLRYKPPVHLLCANAALAAGSAAASKALGMIGRAIARTFPLPFSLALFYHPSVAEVAAEIERAAGIARDGDIDAMKQALETIPDGCLRPLLPIAFEFPEWLEMIEAIEPFGEQIHEAVESIG